MTKLFGLAKLPGLTKTFLGALLFGFLTLLSPTVVFAGGGGVYATASNTEDPHWNTVRVYFDPGLFTCKGMRVSFNFENPADGDKISGSNGDNSSTITEDATYQSVNGNQYLRCSTYAKVYSPKLELNRHLNISFKGEGSDGSRTIAISFGSQNYDDDSLLPWEEIPERGVGVIPSCTSGNCIPGTVGEVTNPKVEVRVLRQELLDQDNRIVTIKWGGFDNFPFTSKIYVSTDKNNWTLLMDSQKGPAQEFNLVNQDYYIKLNGCMDKVGTCVDSNVLFVPKMTGQEVKITPSSTQSVDTSNGNHELEQKIASLEAQLAESKQEQSVLQQRVNDLVNFIKSIFPFFK